ncbi:MAG: hypothetical protein KDD35_10340 [Bdellovibrionales bacterium]|nr:hypothetical protein [Bdellovibrionales bacterium]
MATQKKLDTFNLRDKYQLSSERIIEEAQASAIRRAEVMGWIDVTVRPSDVQVTSDGEYKCYSFEIWGVEVDSSSLDSTLQEKDMSSQEPRSAAREADL